MVNLGGQDPTTARRDDGNNVSQAGQVFADLLLVASTASRCPLALVSVVKGGSWSTLSFGAEREALEDPGALLHHLGPEGTRRSDGPRQQPGSGPQPLGAIRN